MAKYLMSEKTANFIRQQMVESQLNANGAAGETRRTRNSFFVPDIFAHPFEVKWGASVDNGTNDDGSVKDAGSWIIWLPSDDLLMINGVSVDVKRTLTAAGEPYPEGWYRLDEDVLSKTAGGSLWLVITYSESAATTAKFANAREFTDGESFSILIADVKVDETTNVRSVKQTIDSGIVLAGGKGNCTCTKQYPDGMSLSNAQKGNESEGVSKSNFWSIKGFGKFTEGGNEMGTYEEATDMEIGSTAADSCAVLCRVGESSAADGNSIAYRKLKLASSVSGYPSAFEYATKDSEGNDITPVIRNNTFMNGYKETTLADYTDIPTDGTVYLNVVGEKVDKQMSITSGTSGTSYMVEAWEFTASMSNTKLDAVNNPMSEIQYSIPLYKFEAGKVAVDYRTTFLTISSNMLDYGMDAEYCYLHGVNDNGSEASVSNGFAFYNQYSADFKLGKLCRVTSRPVQYRLLAANTNVDVRAIKDKDGNALSYFVGTADVQLSGSGGGGSSSDVSEEIDVITSVGYDANTHYLYYTSKKITITKGVITAIVDNGQTNFTQAVEES